MNGSSDHSTAKPTPNKQTHYQKGEEMHGREAARIRKAMKLLGVKPEGSSDETLSQQKLRRVEQLKDELAAIKKKYADELEDVETVMKSGASVSTGRRGVVTGLYWRRHPSYKSALSERQQKEVLARTPYKPYYQMRFISTNGNNGKGKE